ncbi:hypothetical protein TOPH_02772 [Tolypocladium ophioglossoides CBS 100239]|uniref:Uncharacterized protein n=1 Tax=Tolypocladium ophioglossoides (strain CBS 100239) TaxID=1163406 RepID=A0A0L0NFP0_TOLOC|nr:hypothetical protein TOPH_02772 [Tolypocladium ophioglossoides CBS 100239]
MTSCPRYTFAASQTPYAVYREWHSSLSSDAVHANPTKRRTFKFTHLTFPYSALDRDGFHRSAGIRRAVLIGTELGLSDWGFDGVILAPKVLFALEEADHPGREEATGDAPRPVLLLVDVGGNDATAAGKLDEPDHGVDEDIRADTTDEAVGDGEGKGHEGDGEEGRDGVAHVLPVDLSDGAGHHGADEDEDAAGGPGRDGGEDGSEEDGDEEADAGDHGGHARFAALGDASTGLDEGGDGGHAEDGADGDADGVDHVGDGGTLKVLGDGVDEAGEAGHAVQGTRAVEDVDIEEGDEGEAELAAVLGDVPLQDVEDVLDAVEADDVLEEVEGVVADGGVGEVGDGGAAGPGDGADEDDADDDGALDAVHGQEDGEDAATEDAHPHGGMAHLVPAGARAVCEEVLGRAAGELGRGGGGADDEADALAVGEADDGEEEADADAGGDLDGVGDGAGEPLAHAEDGEAEEDEALDQDGREGDLVGHEAGAVAADYGMSAGGNTKEGGAVCALPTV